MTQEEILVGLKEIFATVKPAVPQDSITLDSQLVQDLGIDSLSILLISIAIETRFGFRFEGVPPFQTVGDVVNFIAQKVA